jgi:hypothetical protein
MNGTDQLEFSERTAREILNKLEAKYGIHNLRAAYKLMCCAEALLEVCERKDTWQSLGEAANRVVDRLKQTQDVTQS